MLERYHFQQFCGSARSRTATVMHNCLDLWMLYAQIFSDSPPSALDTHAQLAQDLFSLREDLRAPLSRGRLCGSRVATGAVARLLASASSSLPLPPPLSLQRLESNPPALSGNLSGAILTAANSEQRSITEYSRTVSVRYVLGSLFVFTRSRARLHLLSSHSLSLILSPRVSIS